MNKPKILATQYSMSTKSIEIYVAGCKGNPHCTGCHNPETWSFDQGEPYSLDFFMKLQQKYLVCKTIIKNIMIFGGEPLDSDIEEMLKDLSTLGIPIWLFTHYEMSEVPKYAIKYCNYFKCGRYDESLLTDNNIKHGIKLASSNQTIYKKLGSFIV